MSFVRFSSEQTIYSGIVYESKDNYFLFQSRLERFYIYEKDNNYEIGDILAIKGKKTELAFAMLESQFDFKNYLNKKGVYNRLYANKIEVKFSNPVRPRSFRNSFLSNFSHETGSLIGGILFSEYDSSETTSIMKELHLSRFLSASGFYIHIYLNVFTYLFHIFIKRKWAKLMSLGFLGVYSILSFPRLTLIRIMMVSLVSWINEYIIHDECKLHRFDVLGISGFLVLLLDYHFAYQDSFILGFTIPIAFFFAGTLARKFKRKYRKAVSLVLFYPYFFPFEINYNREFSIFGFVFQLLFTPFFIILGITSIVCMFGVPIYGLVEYLAEMTLAYLKFTSPLSIVIYASPINDYLFTLYEISYFLFIYFLSFDFQPFRRVAQYSMITILLISMLPMNFISMEVSFINVGQGDACLVRKGETAVLIDTGGSVYRDLAKESLIPYFKKKHIYDIDVLITTHSDYDHSGAKDSLMANFVVRNFFDSEDNFPFVINGITFWNYNQHISEAKDENSTSLVIGFSIFNTNFLITGDAPIKIEKEIIEENRNIPCDILKVGHHGSNTSTCEEFLTFLSPKEAVISVGVNNSYGHPSKSVLELLEDKNIKIRRTDQEGTITYKHYIFM